MSDLDLQRAANRLARAEGLDEWTALMRVLLVKLRGMSLPVILRPALARAERHWGGDSVDLLESKAEVWSYINRNWPGGDDVGVAEGRAARALLCVLEPWGDEEALSMTAEWFAAMTDDEESTS